jgi:hypothetical protein
MDEIPVPEIVELSPPSGRRSHARSGRSLRAIVAMLRVAVFVSLVLVGAAAGLHWGPFEDATAERGSGASPAPAAASSRAEMIPAALLHEWERPYNVAPGPDVLGSGSLRIASGSLAVRKDPDPTASTSSVAASGADSLVVTATAETLGCRAGALGTYRVVLEGKGTVLTLTASRPDACPAREARLAGPWVRADFPPPPGNALAPGRHRTTVFDPLSGSGSPQRLSYSVPAGWEVGGDDASGVELHRVPDVSTGDAGPDPFIVVMTRPAVARELEDGATCGPTGEAPGVGQASADIVLAITTRPGVVSTPPKALPIGGMEGTMLDLHVATSWTRGCQGPEGRIRAVALLEEQGSNSGPFIGLAADHPLRLILFDLGDGRTLAIAAGSASAQPGSVEPAVVATVMPIIESFEIVPAAGQASGPTPEASRP